MIPMQIFGLVVALAGAVICGRLEQCRLIREGIDLTSLSESGGLGAGEAGLDDSLRRPKLFWINLFLTVIVIALLVEATITPYLIFLFGTMVAMAINYPNMKLQGQLLKKYAPQLHRFDRNLAGCWYFPGNLL